MIALFLATSGLLLFTWIGYPAVVRLLAAFAGSRPTRPDESWPLVSVVVATRDSDAVILARVQDILSGSYPTDRLEVIVALDPRRDPRQLLAPLPGPPGAVRTVVGDEPGGKAAALNAAVRDAQGAVLAFTDAGQRFAPDTIMRLVAALQADSRLAAVSGALTTRAVAAGRVSVADLYWRYERGLRAAEARVHSSIGVTGAVYAMHRHLWQPLPPGLILDDLYTPMHAVLRGYRIGFEPDATATDDRRFSPQDEYRRKVRTLTGVLQLCAWLPGVLAPWRNPVWIQFVSHKLLRLLTPWLAIVAGGSALAWLTSAGDAGSLRAVAGVAALAAIVIVLGVRRLREAAWGVLLMQAAIVRATLNAARGEWDVWRR
ncbi:MAG: glycosyltransferase [Gemmatimonadaceae bacterium]|nr:glycosyltransferase [Gemmatimonadaceae bacterium]